jgi:hypothetical protein
MSLLKVNSLQDLGSDPVVTNGVLAKSSFPTGSILQVVSTTKTSVFSATLAQGVSTSITGLTATITPTSINSKILVVSSVTTTTSSDGRGTLITLTRGGVDIAIGDPEGVRQRVTMGSQGGGDNTEFDSLSTISTTILDSPSSTSSLTYGASISHQRNASALVKVNASDVDSNVNNYARGVSSITLMEVAG